MRRMINAVVYGLAMLGRVLTILFILAIIWAFLWLVLARGGAPIPPPKPVVRLTKADFVGDWHLTWCNGKGTCQLAKDGTYYEQWYGTTWEGAWDLTRDEDGLVIKVVEYPLLRGGIYGNPMTWSARLKRETREGTMGSDPFALRPRRPAKPDA